MKAKKVIAGIVSLALLSGIFSACGKTDASLAATSNPESKTTGSNTAESTAAENEKVTLKGIADLVPHSELIAFVTPILAEQGIEVILVSTSADSTTNEKTAAGEVDFNFFQHEPYLQEWNETNGFNLINAGDIHIEPITAYSDKYAATADIPEDAVVAIPNDGTNEYRALLILEQNGFITLNEETATSLSASVTDIKEYLRPIKIIELDSAQIIPTKDDFDFFITNTNKALEAKIKSAILFSEGSESPYANIIAVDESQKDNPAIAELVKALQSKETQEFILEKYDGAVIPAHLD